MPTTDIHPSTVMLLAFGITAFALPVALRDCEEQRTLRRASALAAQWAARVRPGERATVHCAVLEQDWRPWVSCEVRFRESVATLRCARACELRAVMGGR